MNDRLLAVDAGWPGTLYEYARLMKTIGCNLENIAWSIVTHFHMDHAGLISELIGRGINCHVFENQIGAIDAMEKTMEKNNKKYKRIEKEKLQLMNIRDSRKARKSIGISGEVVVTDYHSPDSITFVSDDGEAIIGDLPPAGQMMPDDRRFLGNWEILRKMGVKTIYPSHAELFQLEME